MSAVVHAVVATFQRPRELARLLASLVGVERAVVCDNDDNRVVQEIVKAAGQEYLAPGRNLGCGGGLRMAEEHAWKISGGEFSHLLVLDDDALLEPETLPRLLAALERHGADAACPLATGEERRTAWLPGLKDPLLHRVGKKPMMPQDYRAALGVSVAEFTWAQGICLLVRREAVEAAGWHRGDFWVRGEDLDFSLRLTARGKGIFVPKVEVRHLPPAGSSSAAGERGAYLRDAAMVQNIAYLALTQPHGRPIRHSLPSVSLRFLRRWGVAALCDLGRAIHRGAVRREPAGTGAGETFRRRFDALANR